MDGNINLPQYIADSKVYYEESEKPVSPLLFVLLGGAAILVVIIADKKKVKDNAIKRKKELLYDYSEVVSKLTLLLYPFVPVFFSYLLYHILVNIPLL